MDIYTVLAMLCVASGCTAFLGHAIGYRKGYKSGHRRGYSEADATIMTQMIDIRNLRDHVEKHNKEIGL